MDYDTLAAGEELCGELQGRIPAGNGRARLFASLAIALLWRAFPSLEDTDRLDVLERIAEAVASAKAHRK